MPQAAGLHCASVCALSMPCANTSCHGACTPFSGLEKNMPIASNAGEEEEGATRSRSFLGPLSPCKPSLTPHGAAQHSAAQHNITQRGSSSSDIGSLGRAVSHGPHAGGFSTTRTSQAWLPLNDRVGSPEGSLRGGQKAGRQLLASCPESIDSPSQFVKLQLKLASAFASSDCQEGPTASSTDTRLIVMLPFQGGPLDE